MSQLAQEVANRRRLPPPAIASAIRREAGVTQERLARELGVSRVSISRWESGSRVPSGENRNRYADLLEEIRREVTRS
jgi:transcriptional regulator with XRE-family HTH domain